PKLKRQGGFIARMRAAQITGLFRPCLAEKPEQYDIHENSRKAQRLVEIRRDDRSRSAQTDEAQIPKSPGESSKRKGETSDDDRRSHKEMIPMRIFEPVQKIAE